MAVSTLYRTLTLTALLALTACKPGLETEDNGEPNPDPTARNFIGPAQLMNVWLLKLEEDAFEFTQRTRANGTWVATARGDYETLSSEFSRFTVDHVNGNNTPMPNARIPALAIENDLLLLHNWNVSGQLLPLVPRGDCPATTLTANWIQLIQPASHFAINDTAGFFGQLQYNAADATLEVAASFALASDFAQQPTQTITVGSCANGVARRGEQNQIFFADNGTALVYQNAASESSLWLAAPRESISAADLDGNYIGFWTDNSRDAAERLWNVAMECTSNNCTVERLTTIEDLNSVSQSFTLNLDEDAFDQPAEGFITGNTQTDLGTEGFITAPISCLASADFLDTGHKFLACVGQSPSNLQLTVTGLFIAKD